MESFGRFQLLRRLAEGGMGELFLAQQDGIAGFAKQLVVKRIKPTLAGDPSFVEMFLHEARVAALIDHPNVVHIHELGQVEGRYFIAMEYVPGRSLADVMEQLTGPLELSIALYVMASLCEGLAYAHAAVGLDGRPLGLVHRDVSPPNVLLGYSGAVKLSDFGIAKIQHNQHTAAGVLKGKFAYLSPEQARGEPVDARSDIYALGLLLFEMTVGRRANPGATDTGLIFAAARGEVIDPRDLLSDYPEPLRRMISRATALDPAARYLEAKELQEDLLAFQLEQRLVTTAGRVGEWLRELRGSEPGDQVLVPEAEGLRGALTATTSPDDAAATPVVTGAPPKVAFAPTMQVENPVDVEIDLASERPGWGWEARRSSIGPLAPSGHGLTILVVIVLVAVVGGVVFLFYVRGSPKAEPRGGSIAADPDARPTRRRWRDATPRGRAVDTSRDLRRVAPSRPDVEGHRIPRQSPAPALPPAPAPRPPRLRLDAGAPAPGPRPAAPAAALDARHVYWTESGPVLP